MEWYLKVLKNYAVFNGRARRKEYWMFVLFNAIALFLLGFVDGATGMYDPQTGNGTLSSIYYLAVLIPSLAVGVRRMHDVGKSGWFLLIPIYNLVLACTDSETNENKYGPSPKSV